VSQFDAAPALPAGADQRATRAEIDLDVLQGNVAALKATLAPGVELMAVVKANAYGHGARMVAPAALAGGASRLAVATVSEGRQLRRAGIDVPILVLSPISAAEVPLALETDLDLTIGTQELLTVVAGAAEASGARPGLHIKLDSGMHRYGAAAELAINLATQVAEHPNLRLAGLMTHFAVADEPDDQTTDQQAALFESVLDRLVAQGIRPEHHHLANSAATLRDPRWHGSMVRTGIAMYGLPPAPGFVLPAAVRPVMTVRSQVMRVHCLTGSDAVGYGRTYTPATPESAALVPIGYADGYRRSFSNRAWMGIGGQRAPVAGRVSMDQTVVRLPADLPVELGMEVDVMGGEAGPTATELAELSGTINYEIVCGISPRVPRHYLRGGQVIAVESLPD
jgi:alanine racemase